MRLSDAQGHELKLGSNDSVPVTINGSLANGENIIGKVGIDQTTDGATNRVVAKISQAEGENVVGLAAGTNNIGDVDVLTLPALPAGTNKIGSIDVLSSIDTTNSTPVVGSKTITATAAEIFAGASAKTNRRKLFVKSEESVLRFRIGPSTVTQQSGTAIEPGAAILITLDPAIAVPVYAISEGASLQVTVWEV